MQDADLFDVVELVVDLPQHGLYAGMQGTVLDAHDAGGAFEVEFSDEQGRAIIFLALTPEQFVVVWQAKRQQWVPLAERIAELVTRLPQPAGAEVFDFARFLNVRAQRVAHPPAAPLSVAETQEEYRT